MKVNQTILAAAILALVAIAVLIFLQARTQSKQIDVSYADLQASIDRELSRSPEVGFLPRVRFRYLKVSIENGVVIEGSGRWFSVGAGAYTLPDITFSARLPTEASEWSVSDGNININQVQITRAFREAFDGSDGSNESKANVDGWQEKLSAFIRRLDVFEDEALMTGDWRVISFQSRPDSLIFLLQN